MIRRVACVLTLVAGMLSAVPAAATGHDVPNKLDAALEQAAAEFGAAGVQAVVLRHGRVVWSGKRGAAVIEPHRRVTDRTMFSYASLSKLMLAAFVLRQVEKGVLDLDEPISTYVGDEVAGSRVVTIRMLLTHTAGYPDLYADPATAPLFPPGDQYNPDRPYTFEMLAPGIGEPVDPGARFEYSNTGYLVLGHVVVRTSGGAEAFRHAYQRFIGLPENQVTMERSERAYRNFAHGYQVLEDGSLQDFFTAYGATGSPTDLYGLPFTDGLFAGTALGAGRVLDALFARGTLLHQKTLAQMITPSPQSDDYGMGTYRFEGPHHRTWQGHGGAYIGYNSQAATDLDNGVTIVVVINQLSERGPAEVIWRALADAYVSATGAGTGSG